MLPQPYSHCLVRVHHAGARVDIQIDTASTLHRDTRRISGHAQAPWRRHAEKGLAVDEHAPRYTILWSSPVVVSRAELRGSRLQRALEHVNCSWRESRAPDARQ